ncbi:ABC transporter substrate-binding protein [Evansella cellulosilytica]|uniref:Extracellular solute-binding protein family 5 n=1 Tax=Evansella cellulosilytica (strain ATCC 21833 / DSM 2522 / FERM P-1141 / JCM 9156 / N-4) TaxID=649639 RepID=E6TZ04_EVAC2|nr:ABC transporter substrate-binding protein [Evansella cellulosilytica]ADU32447.1 extracellular solute-binding protein family 5 [Evansella cellulosilytica DSM 2522]
MLKKIYLVIAFIVIVSIVSACNSTTSKEDSAELVIAAREIAASFDPVEPLTSSYLRGIGAAEALFYVNADGEVEPYLAESAVEVNPTTWEIKLRQDIYFWSGKKVDATAVIASLERSREKDLQALPFLEELSFSQLDEYTIQVTTNRKHMSVPLNLSYYQTVIHNAEAAFDSIDTMDFTGMYKVVEFSPNQKMVLEVNEDYWGKKPTIQRVTFEEISDEQTRVLSALSGQSHIALNVGVTSLSQFENNSDVRTLATPVANTQTIYLNLNKPQFQDVRVRQALAWALNREELVTLAAEGQSIPVTTWLSSNPVFSEAKSAVYEQFDINKAATLLDEAGWELESDGLRYKDGNLLTLRLMTWGGDKALGEAIQNQWTQIGVKADVQHGDYSLIQAARETGDWDASIEAWSTFGDIYALMLGQFSPDGSANYGGYNDKETNELLAQLSEATDDEARYQLALKINERVASQAPGIYLFPRPEITAISNELSGFELHFRQFENIVNPNMSLDGVSKE